jgi:hypothetical protein
MALQKQGITGTNQVEIQKNPDEFKSEHFLLLKGLNEVLVQCIAKKSANTKDVLEKIEAECSGSIINMCEELQTSGIFKTVLEFLAGGVGSDIEVVKTCFNILDAFEIDSDHYQKYLTDQNIEMFTEMAHHMD